MEDRAAKRIHRIAKEVQLIRVTQEGLWGSDFDAKNTPNDWVAFITHYLGLATYTGRGPVSDYTPERFRENMLKVSAIAQAAVAVIDAEGKCGARHYENLPKSGAKE